MAAPPEGMERTQLTPSSWVDRGRVPKDLAPAPRTPDFEALWALRPAEQGTVMIWGREQTTPRYQQAWGVPYSFSGQTLFAGGPVPPALQRYLDWANRASGYGAGRFNGILLNWYANGLQHIGLHSDDERQLVPGEPILSLSLGQTRTFRVLRRRDYAGPAAVEAQEWGLGHGALLVMGGDAQKTHKHEVKKVSGRKGQDMGRRINITIRAFRTGPGGAAAPAAAQPVAAQPQPCGGGGGSEKSGGGSGSGGDEPASKRQHT